MVTVTGLPFRFMILRLMISRAIVRNTLFVKVGMQSRIKRLQSGINCIEGTLYPGLKSLTWTVAYQPNKTAILVYYGMLF